jgi:hypothetical protein
MLRILMAVFLLTFWFVDPIAAIAPPAKRSSDKRVFTGVIQDVRGITGRLVLRPTGKQADKKAGKKAGKKKTKDRVFDISEARILGPDGDEWKVGDLREGDEIRVTLTRSGRLVKEVRVLKAKPRL